MDQSRANFLTRRSKRREPQYSDVLRLADYPPPYPDGWYRLLRSKSLRRGPARYLECLGRALVVWRSEDADEVFAMSAFCPHHWFAERRVPRLLVWNAVGGWVSQWRNDVRIWEEKAFMAPPMLCRDDGPVMRQRGWYRQFFPELAADQAF